MEAYRPIRSLRKIRSSLLSYPQQQQQQNLISHCTSLFLSTSLTTFHRLLQNLPLYWSPDGLISIIAFPYTEKHDHSVILEMHYPHTCNNNAKRIASTGSSPTFPFAPNPSQQNFPRRFATYYLGDSKEIRELVVVVVDKNIFEKLNYFELYYKV